MGKLQKINEIIVHEPDELDFFQSITELIQSAKHKIGDGVPFVSHRLKQKKSS